METKALCFTGHRPKDLDGMVDIVKAQLKKMIAQAYANGYTQFYSGMALGVDTYAAEAALALREEYPDIYVFAVVPFPGQTMKFGPTETAQWVSILSRVDEVVMYIPETDEWKWLDWKEAVERNRQHCKTGWEFHQVVKWLDDRNRFMIDQADAVLAVSIGKSKGGTANAIRYANSRNKRLVVFNPITGKISRRNFIRK